MSFRFSSPLRACLVALLVIAQTVQAASAIAEDLVSVTVAGAVLNPGTFELPRGARLSDASVAAQVSSRAWFLGAALLRSAQLEPQHRLKAGLLFDIQASQVDALARSDMAAFSLLARLYAAVEAMPVTGRVPAKLNPLQQLLLPNNTLLQDGDRILYPHRPGHVRITGAVQDDCTLDFDPALKLTDYLEQCPAHKVADKSYAHVIQPDGTHQQYGIAAWNQQPAPVAVGAVIYLPLDRRHLADSSESVNNDFAAMLATQYQLGGRFSE